jgi:hypothetical protein
MFLVLFVSGRVVDRVNESVMSQSLSLFVWHGFEESFKNSVPTILKIYDSKNKNNE